VNTPVKGSKRQHKEGLTPESINNVQLYPSVPHTPPCIGSFISPAVSHQVKWSNGFGVSSKGHRQTRVNTVAKPTEQQPGELKHWSSPLTVQLLSYLAWLAI